MLYRVGKVYIILQKEMSSSCSRLQEFVHCCNSSAEMGMIRWGERSRGYGFRNVQWEGTMIGLGGEHNSNGLHEVGIKVRFYNCNRNAI